MTETPYRTPRRVWRAAAALLLATALTGCLKIDLDLSVEGETISGTLVTAVDEQAAQAFEMQPEDVFGEPGEDDFANLDGVTAQRYDQDGWVGVEYTFDQASITDLSEIAGEDEELPRIRYDADEQIYEFLLTLDVRDWFAEDELGAEDFPLDPQVVRERFEARISVTFPGQVSEHNGELSGTTVTWQPPAGERTEMRAVADATGGSAPGGAPEDGPGGAPEEGPAGGLPGLDGAEPTSTNTSTGTALLVALAVLVLAAGGGLAAWLGLRRRGAAATAGTSDGTAVIDSGTETAEEPAEETTDTTEISAPTDQEDPPPRE